MQKGLKKIVFIVLVIILGLVFYYKMTINPDEIIVCYYNEMTGFHETFIIRNDSLGMDTISEPDYVKKETYKPTRPDKIIFGKPEVSIKLQLLFERNEVFGCPGCIDQGGIIMKIKKFGVTKVFIIDPFKEEEFSEGILVRIKKIVS